LTGDCNILNVRVVVQFAINDPAAYLFRRVTRTRFWRMPRAARSPSPRRPNVDDLLTTGKADVQERVRETARATLERYRSGISIIGVVLDAIVPPEEVVDAFRLVSSAREDSDRIVREAESCANGVLPVARGQAARLGQGALAYNTQMVEGVVGDASRFSGAAAEYGRAPRETMTRLYLETMDEVLPKMNRTIIGADPRSVDLQFIRGK
jgi:membrane protease subunit HflK